VNLHISLMQGWVPVAIQIVTVALLVFAIGWRTRRWRRIWLPVSALVGVSVALATYWNIATNGLAGDPAPLGLWAWLALTGLAVGVAVLGWRSADWRRRGASMLTVPLAMLCSALMLNLWVGYFPTIQTAWGQLTGGPLPGQTDSATVARMLASNTVPAKGTVLPVTISADASGFAHRTEWVYLPPAYFASDPPPALPTVMMIGGQFNTAADWLRAGNAIATIDEFAAKHDGNAPVFVFVDSVGSFNNDTGCVNGTRGNAADHLTEDVVPFMIDTFGVSDDPANWAVLGWSTGGTCAVNLTVKYPDLFSTFVNIDGDIAPNTGTKAQTIERLFGGDADAYAQWDPATLIAENGSFDGDVAGWFAVSAAPGTVGAAIPGSSLPKPPADIVAATPAEAARALCGLGNAYDIECSVVPQAGKHDWPFAAQVLAASLPWLASQIDTPDVPEVLLPGTPTQPEGVSIAAEGGTQITPTPRPTGVR
jgi:S-formylglutathione hydrolase FrmB